MSGAKRPPMKLGLDVAALEQKAVSQPDPVKVAVEKLTVVPPTPRSRDHAPRTPEQRAEETARARQRSRAGKVAVQTYVFEDVRRRLKVLAAQTDVTIEEYLARAIDELLRQHGAAASTPRAQLRASESGATAEGQISKPRSRRLK